MIGCAFDSSRANYGAALFAIDCSTTILNTMIVNNTIYISGILLVNKGDFRSQNTSMVNNVASRGTIALTSCAAIFEGSTTLTNNEGSFYVLASEITFSGRLSITNCTPFFINSSVIPISEGGAMILASFNVQYNSMKLLP